MVFMVSPVLSKGPTCAVNCYCLSSICLFVSVCVAAAQLRCLWQHVLQDICLEWLASTCGLGCCTSLQVLCHLLPCCCPVVEHSTGITGDQLWVSVWSHTSASHTEFENLACTNSVATAVHQNLLGWHVHQPWIQNPTC